VLASAHFLHRKAGTGGFDTESLKVAGGPLAGESRRPGCPLPGAEQGGRMSRGSALRRSMAMLIVASGAVLGTSSPAAAEWVGVWVRDSEFAPQERKIAPGDAVAFVQDSRLTHSITWDNGDFPERELSGDWRAVGYVFRTAGRFAYHCKYHGGQGMSGMIVVGDPGPPPPPPPSTTTTTEPPPSTTSSTTTTTRPATTTTTRPPTTTTTEPPATTTTEPPPPPATEPPAPTTTEPPTTTTTRNTPIVTQRPPAPPSALTSDTTAPPKPPAATDKKKAGAGSSPSRDKGRTAAPAGNGPSTTTSTEPQVLAEEVVPPVVLEQIPVVEPATPSTEPGEVQTLDDLALGRLGDREEKPPRRDRSGFMTGAGIGVGVFLIVAAAWAWYHRPSRYMPA
jgi:plastocyanin